MSDGQHSSLCYTFATWAFELFVAGVDPADDSLSERLRTALTAKDPESGEAAGHSLVDRVAEILGADEGPDGVLAAAQGLYGERAKGDLGRGERDERTTRIRKYQFGARLPWLARIWERQEDGGVAPGWVVVEEMTDQVLAMDPNPWNDIDEKRVYPVSDFHVLWELDGCTSVHIAH